jgi:hypothetical protein
MVASALMKLRATVISIAKISAVFGLAACGGGAGGKLMVDTPVLPYQAPDIGEVTGIEEPDNDEASGSGSTQAGK